MKAQWADLSPRQRKALVAPAVGIVLLALGGLAWVAGGQHALGILVGAVGLAAIVWGIAMQQRDPALRGRQPPLTHTPPGSEGTGR